MLLKLESREIRSHKMSCLGVQQQFLCRGARWRRSGLMHNVSCIKSNRVRTIHNGNKTFNPSKSNGIVYQW